MSEYSKFVIVEDPVESVTPFLVLAGPDSAVSLHRSKDRVATARTIEAAQKIVQTLSGTEPSTNPVMRLYVWNKDVLRDYKSGLAIALARSEDEARKLLLDEIGFKPAYSFSGNLGLGNPADEVVEVTHPYAIYIYGSQ